MAEDRKTRLAALAARAGRANKPDGQVTATAGEGGAAATGSADVTPAVKFRNYAPKDASLDGQDGAPTAGGGDGAAAAMDSTNDVNTSGVTPAAKRQRTDEPSSALEEALLQAKAEASAITGGDGSGQGGNLASMAPKKVNSDLKRDIQGKLDKLERRTQRALVALLKERLEKEAEAEADEDGLD